MPTAIKKTRQHITLNDYRETAKTVLSKSVFDYVDGWAGNGLTQRANRSDFDRIVVTPLVMRDVSQPDLSVTYLGRRSALPVGFSPSAFQQLAHHEGELATVDAASAMDVPMIVSAMSSRSLEEIAERACGARLWLHVYVFRDRGVTRQLIERAEKAGFEAISLGLGCPAMGKRYANVRNRFTLPDDVQAANFSARPATDFNNPISTVADAELDPSATWRDIASVCGSTRLPVVGKGLMNPLDVEPALNAGLAGLMVSNHGGRQMDGTISTIRALPDVADAVAGRVPVFLDGGARYGTDIMKALALGANAVFLGRPVMWALTVGGARTVAEMVSLLADELRLALQLAGCTSSAEVRDMAGTLLRVSNNVHWR